MRDKRVAQLDLLAFDDVAVVVAICCWKLPLTNMILLGTGGRPTPVPVPVCYYAAVDEHLQPLQALESGKDPAQLPDDG
jgi:hypothetical protein